MRFPKGKLRARPAPPPLTFRHSHGARRRLPHRRLRRRHAAGQATRHRPLPLRRGFPLQALPPRRHSTPLRTRHRHPPRLRPRAPRAGFAFTSVSGGSITAAQWAIALSPSLRAPSSPPPSLRGATPLVGDEATPSPQLPIQHRPPASSPHLKRHPHRTHGEEFLLPWNWFRGAPTPRTPERSLPGA